MKQSRTSDGESAPEISRSEGQRAYGHRAARVVTLCLAVGSALAFISAYHPPRSFERAPFAPDSAFGEVVPAFHVAPISVGRSGAVHMEFALPGARIAHPLTVDLPGRYIESLAYTWESLGDSVAIDPLRSLSIDSLVVPREPGLYRLTLVADGLRRVVDGLTLAVLVPFDHKKGPVLDGYRIGTYGAERRGGDDQYRPLGFVKVTEDEAELSMSEHLRLGDLLTRDGQESWPRFIAVNPRMVDKLELVLERVAGRLRDSDVDLLVNIHSGYRTPAHNRRVPRAASDSRHQYGDAVDVAIDANGDGRITARDARLVGAAVDSVEAEFPDLTGGVGVYTSSRYRQPYVHIDVRGSRVRWRG